MVATLGSSVFDFFDQTLRDQAGRKQLDSLAVHASQKLFAVVIDEANIRQINQYRYFISWTRLPALVQFVDTTASQLAFEKEPRR